MKIWNSFISHDLSKYIFLNNLSVLYQSIYSLRGFETPVYTYFTLRNSILIYGY